MLKILAKYLLSNLLRPWGW